MKRQRKFCCYCGGDVYEKHVEGKLRDFCGQCQAVFYENPLPVAASIVVNEDREVLLVKREKEPYQGMWCLPIGFAESDEEVREAALRELKEETGITGEIIRLIDVDTVDNYFYGSLAIVTYEVKAVGGELKPGDDAAAVAYHPIEQTPSLAWISNEKALRIYVDLYRDSWAMLDSFKHLFPEHAAMRKLIPGETEHKSFLSNVLVKLIERDIDQISENWERDMRHGAPKLMPYIGQLLELNRSILFGVQRWLSGEVASDFSRFLATGAQLKAGGVPLPDMVIALALSRRSIWLHVVKKKILSSPLEIYATLELNNRIIFFYDKVFFAIAEGYFSDSPDNLS
jgi:ADP-ribose pyrophosphatase YjhB (NUDIX family)